MLFKIKSLGYDTISLSKQSIAYLIKRIIS